MGEQVSKAICCILSSPFVIFGCGMEPDVLRCVPKPSMTRGPSKSFQNHFTSNGSTEQPGSWCAERKTRRTITRGAKKEWKQRMLHQATKHTIFALWRHITIISKSSCISADFMYDLYADILHFSLYRGSQGTTARQRHSQISVRTAQAWPREVRSSKFTV